MKVILLILILSGGFISSTTASDSGDQGLMFDEDIKEMTLEDILSNNGSDTDTSTSNFDIVDEEEIDEELSAGDPDQDPVKTNWQIVVLCCLAFFILVLLTIGVMFLYMKGNQVLISCFIVFYLSFLF